MMILYTVYSAFVLIYDENCWYSYVLSCNYCQINEINEVISKVHK